MERDAGLPWERANRRTWIQMYMVGAAQVKLNSCARMNRALLTLIGSLVDPMADPAGCERLQPFLESEPVWMPAEGRFEPLLQRDFLQIFEASGTEELIFVPEFPLSDPAVRLPVAQLSDHSIPFPGCGTLLAPDASFLFTVDWDSFFTLFYGPRSFAADAARRLHLEGSSLRQTPTTPGGITRWAAPQSRSHPKIGRRRDDCVRAKLLVRDFKMRVRRLVIRVPESDPPTNYCFSRSICS